MTEAVSPAVAGNFRDPFVGHLPGYLAASEATAPGRPVQEVYDAALVKQWRTLLDSPASQDERLAHTFLERHPSLLPGAYSVDGDSGHPAFPMAVISKPKLPGLSDREPDFMWLATDSESLYPILIEIETPHKKWFHGDRAEIHSQFTHAQGQLAEWRAWFNRGHNRSAFLEHYEIPHELAGRRLAPRFVLIYGRRDNYANSRRRQDKRAELARTDERLMSFDRLTPAKNSVLYSCVRKEQDGYRLVAVPPCLTIFNDGEDYQQVSGWEEALDACLDMARPRREYLRRQLRLLTENPDAYVQTEGGLRVRRPQWL
ncbi:Shedu anti-phage system protein SduA domain-containing protein [Nonomuraea sp. NPDC005650]|uniref:Shedu anti-phage system protein SduA domain-containing protein n=1 Tax=Nonomuraea sp. NPDC005650 TaxID=3157045 RepID=UPI0033B5EAC9